MEMEKLPKKLRLLWWDLNYDVPFAKLDALTYYAPEQPTFLNIFLSFSAHNTLSEYLQTTVSIVAAQIFFLRSIELQFS